jgi:hypothetical protein
MKIFLFLLVQLLPFCKSTEPVEISSFSNALEFIQDPNRTIICFLRSGSLIKFLIQHYENEPLSFLSKLFKSKCILFELFFFTIITSSHSRYEIPLNLNNNDVFEWIISICININTIVPDLFSKPNGSVEEMTKRFSVIKFYIKFAKRYIEYPGVESCSEYKKEKLRQLSSNIQAWKFAIRNLPRISPNGKTIDYGKFFDTFYWILRPNRNIFPKQNECDLDYSNHQFLFCSLIRRMRIVKDFELFNVDNPDLPFLVGYILKYINVDGFNILSSSYEHGNFYNHQYLKTNFGQECKFQSLIKTLKDEQFPVILAKEELGIDICRAYPTSLLIDSLERIPLLCQSSNHHNILWQLKGFTLIRKFLISLRHHNIN